MNIWILDSESGVTLLYKAYMDFSVNEDLVSGLLTALNQFTIVEFKQPIESIDMGGLRWVYLADRERYLLFIAAATKDVKAEMLRARLNVIKESFTQTYILPNPNWRDSWNGDITIFRPFKQIIDEYYTQWLAAENITNIAEFFDILGIFQQLFNLVQNVIELHVDGDVKEKIYQRIENLFEDFLNGPLVKDNPELGHISFDRTSGINIISINPNNCDFLVVEQQLISLLKIYVDLIKKQIGHITALKYFIDENIFDYIFNNMTLLMELNLDKFFLQLFIFK